MFQLYYDGQLVYDPRAEETAIEDASCRLAINEAGSLSFVLPPGHPAYDLLQPRKGLVELQADDLPIYRGRVISDPKDFYLSKTIETEGVLACLNDSVVPPFSFPEDWGEDESYQRAEKSGNVVAFFLRWLLEQHNSQVTEEQQLKVGEITVKDSNNYLYRSSESYAKTWDTLKDKLFGSALGGNLLVRYETDGTYLDYYEELPLTNVQAVAFGENLLDLTRETDYAEVYSAILPLGAEGLTLEALPDGPIDDDLVKEGKLIYSRSARQRYGNVTQPMTWEDVTEAENLRSKAAAQLVQTGMKGVETITATAVDLGLTGEDVPQLRVGRNTKVQSPPHGLADTYPLTELEIALLTPENTRITLGKSTYTLSSQMNQSVSALQSQVEAVKVTANDAVVSVGEEYYLSISPVALEGGSWSVIPPDWTEGRYLWSRSRTVSASGTVTYGEAKCLAGATGQAGEDATLLRIDSSRGTVFKNSAVSTVLSAVIYHGAQRITCLSELQAAFGSGAYLEWAWQRLDEQRFGVISASDERLGEDGFTFTLSPDDVDTKVTFQCNLIV